MLKQFSTLKDENYFEVGEVLKYFFQILSKKFVEMFYPVNVNFQGCKRFLEALKGLELCLFCPGDKKGNIIIGCLNNSSIIYVLP